MEAPRWIRPEQFLMDNPVNERQLYNMLREGRFGEDAVKEGAYWYIRADAWARLMERRVAERRERAA